MTRCDFDGVFYRVFCVTLLAIAFTFTVILTNVFIDIDGLLSFKGNVKTVNKQVFSTNPSNLAIGAAPKPDPFDDDDKDYEELDDNYRTKRSLESQNILFHVKNPKLKGILTNRLAKLLEKLDEEEPSSYIRNDNVKSNEATTRTDAELQDEKIVNKHEENREAEALREDNFMHLATHNILLQGIIGHMDLHDVYKRIHSFIKNFKDSNDIKEKSDEMKHPEKIRSKQHQSNEESKFFDELLNCKELHDQISEASGKYEERDSRRQSDGHKAPKMIIKTIIDIRSPVDDKVNKKNDTTSVDNIKGIIKLIYNGKSVKFNNIEESTTPPISTTVDLTTTQATKTTTEEAKLEDVSDSVEQNQARIRKSYLNKIFNNYLKQFHKIDKFNSAEIRQLETKRLKRHVKIRYQNDDVTTEKSKPKKNGKEDDELYVEIETHFDSKGMKGEKKKKLIKDLIQKIQKAIHSENADKGIDKKKKHKHVHVKKRTQNPLDNSQLLSKAVPGHINPVIHRQLDPIGKTVAPHESVPNIYDNTGESWKKTYTGPGFLASSKSINSAEMGEVDTYYTKLTNANSIPQRMQKPLNTDGSEESASTNNYYDLGNLKFFIKDIDGTGFSIGFNQYVDEPPDVETIKLFTGLENIIQTYHQKYDPAAPEENATENPDTTTNDNASADNTKPEHVMVRRSIKESDYHSNEYRIIFDSNYVPYENYQEIYENNKRKLHSVKDYKSKNVKFSKDMNAPFIVDEDIFNKNLKPAEIFSLANLLDRKKRAISVKKISNLKSKLKMNRYLNTKAMATKRIFMNKKRNKRQIDKIRIIASDSPHQHRHSDESIFVVSDENMFADRAIVREVNTPQVVENNSDKIEEQHYDIISPYIYEESKEPTYITNIFDGKSRHNALMSKYPHVFMEEISRSKEQYLPDNTLMYSKIIEEAPPGVIETGQMSSTQSTVTTINEINDPQPRLDDIVSVLDQPKTNYKLTVKIMPRNLTDVNTGFKEVHTSINKSYNKNGMMYSSLVNVSEISKIIKLNKTKTVTEASKTTTISPIAKVMKQQQTKINILLKQHKHRIDQQLEHLNRERERLESMIANKNVTDIEDNQSNEIVDLVLSTDPLKVVRMTKNEMTKLAASAFTKTQETEVNIANTIPPPVIISTTDYTTSSDTTTVSTTSTSTTTELTTTEAPKSDDKTKILQSIEKNDRLTNEILMKIDKNTEILQIFLAKLTENITPQTTRKSMADSNVPSKVNLNEQLTNWKDYTNHDPFFSQPMPNLEVQKNNSHVSIPFVYAYQQPFHLPDGKAKNPVASIVYHGHIHTNAITNKGDMWKGTEQKNEAMPVKNSNIKRAVNETRFFIDELDNYKVIPVPPLKKPVTVPIIDVAKIANVTAN